MAERKTETKGATGSDACARKEKAPNSVGAYFLTFLSYQVRNGLVKERISWVVGQFPGCPSSGPQTILLPIASYLLGTVPAAKVLLASRFSHLVLPN